MRKLPALALSCALLLGLAATALGYSDLPEGHWAHTAMTVAVSQGMLKGYEDGTMHPDDTLSWAQCLTMLGRTFYYADLEQHPVAETDHWAKGAYDAALALGVLERTDFLPVSPDRLDAPITRQDTAVLVDRVLLRLFKADPVAIDLSAQVFTDFTSLPEPYRASVLQCCARGITKGYEDGCFGGGDPLSRASGASLLVRALAVAQEPPAEAVPPVEDPAPQPEEPATSLTPPGGEVVMTGPLRALGDNGEKRMLLYGTDEVNRYSSKEEADAHVTTVTVPVWRLDKTTGIKTPNAISFQVNAAIADDMVQIFTEIFNDPEQVPIYSIGGYAWRGTGAKGEHNCGTAVDINYLENYQIYPDGRVAAGQCWLPGENPWSIPEEGSVVRIFNAYGYSWGGNAWPSYSNKDYMHFSYLGL